ncbi:MAG TPA: RidA family protein [Chitinophagaceae bacterium]|nr:MAG: endoribonuclease L-PSP [Bacteroidetes bacterium OLB11]HMN32720.1 RidA family protein [Chitinophagaceae bacterium]
MSKKVINTTNAPAPIGPYNQAIEVNGMIFISGQIPLNPSTSELVTNNIEDEATQVMENLKAILTEAGLTFDHVVKTSIFLSDMNLFGPVNTVYARYFTDNFPARETVAVLGLPKDVHVEISMIVAR